MSASMVYLGIYMLLFDNEWELNTNALNDGVLLLFLI